MTIPSDKELIRNIIKTLVYLRSQQKISEHTLRSLIKMAMAYEITTHLEEEMDKSLSLFVVTVMGGIK